MTVDVMFRVPLGLVTASSIHAFVSAKSVLDTDTRTTQVPRRTSCQMGCSSCYYYYYYYYYYSPDPYFCCRR